MKVTPVPLSTVGITAGAADLIRERVIKITDTLLESWNDLSSSPLDPLATDSKKRKGKPIAGTIRPYLFALFPTVARASTIERSFSSSLGTAIQDCAEIIARSIGLEARTEEKRSGLVSSGVRDYIVDLTVENRKTPDPDISHELAIIESLNLFPDKLKIDVILDLFIGSDGIEYYFDLKTPSPNSGKPPLMKKKLLEVQSICISEGVRSKGFAVFHYNPKGTKAPFSAGRQYFDYKNGEVLVGDKFWDFIAGPGTFKSFMDIWMDVGRQRSVDLNELRGIRESQL
jgi:hypothetical protein